jgi:hypothetical protein
MSEAALRAAARREREDRAPRLRDEVPPLVELHLEIEERRSGEAAVSGSHIRRFVVAHAPALFDIPCGERSCRDGGHDLTRQILAALREGKTTSSGEDACNGYSPNGSRCELELHYVMYATYG